MNFFVEKSLIIYFLLFLISFFIGIHFNHSATTEVLPLQERHVEIKLFVSTLTNNLALAVALIVLGLLTFSIFNVATIIWNGLFLGMFFSKIYNLYGMRDAILMTLPHGFFEILWIVLLSRYVLILTLDFYHYLDSKFTNKNFITRLWSKDLAFILVLVFAAVLIEFLVTPFLINNITIR